MLAVGSLVTATPTAAAARRGRAVRATASLSGAVPGGGMRMRREHARGALVSWSEIAINVGILLGFVAAWCFADVGSDTAWRLMLALGAILPSILFVLTLTVTLPCPYAIAAPDTYERR